MMKLTIASVALAISACAGGESDRVMEPLMGADSCAVVRPNFGGVPTQSERGVFAYNVNAPLNLQKVPQSTTNGVEVSSISFDSPAGGRATGMLFNPVTRPSPRPGIVLMHGMPGNALQMTPYAQQLAQYGAAVITIDAPFARRGGSPIRFIKEDREEQIQLIKDLQRAVDVLRIQPGVDDDRIAYVGFSYGGAMGVLFAGIERRLAAAVLVVADGGIVSHYTGSEDLGFMSSMSCSTRVAWFRDMIPIEPIRFIGLAKPTQLLLQSGRTDNLVPEADAQLVHNAAPDPKTIFWYDAGHGLDQQASFDRHSWLREKIGIQF